MVDLSTVLSLEDAYDILEVVSVDAHNRRIIDAANAARRRDG